MNFCGRKQIFTSREQAADAVKVWGVLYGKTMRFYKCDRCSNFHMSSQLKWRYQLRNEDGLREFWLVTTDEDTLIMSHRGFAEEYKKNHGCNEIIHMKEVAFPGYAGASDETKLAGQTPLSPDDFTTGSQPAEKKKNER